MDLPTIEAEVIIIAGAVILLTSAAIYFMSLLGTKERSFEEAMTEQNLKQRSEQLLGVKPKSQSAKGSMSAKEKKKSAAAAAAGGNSNKSTKKQNKKAQKEQRKQELASSVAAAAEGTEVEEEPENLELESHDSSLDKESEQPISDPEVTEVVSEKEAPLLGAAVVLQNGNGDVHVKVNHSQKSGGKSSKKKVKEVAAVAVSALEVASAAVPEMVEVVETVVVREDSKNKSKQQKKIVARNNGAPASGDFNANQMEDLLSKAQLSSSDIQSLIDVLLNRQQRGDSEWVNRGKNDTVTTLKKQLNEKDEQCLNLHTTVQGLQNKIKELRAEFTGEKSSFTQIRRQLDETLSLKRNEVVQLQSRYQKLSDTASDEKSQLLQQLQQAQGTLKSVQIENAGIKTALANLESSSHGKSDSNEETSKMKEQCLHLENQLAAAINTNKEISQQNQTLQNSVKSLEEKKSKDEQALHENYAIQIREREEHLASELKRTQTLGKDSEGLKATLQQEITALQKSIAEFKKSASDAEKKLEDTQKAEKNAKNSLKEAETKLAELENKLTCKDSLLHNLTEENQALNAQVKSLGQPSNKDDIHKLLQDNSDLQKRLSIQEAKVLTLDTEKKNLLNDSDTTKLDLKLQREKNQELIEVTNKLSKAVEDAKSNLETQVLQAQKKERDLIVGARKETETEVEKSFRNLFPEPIFEGKGDWKQNFAANIHAELAKAASSSTVNSDEKVKTYQAQLKTIEDRLHAEQDNAAKNEKSWRAKLDQAESQLSAVKSDAQTAVASSKKAVEEDLKSSLKILFPESSFEGSGDWRTNFSASINEKLKASSTSDQELDRLRGEVKQHRLSLETKTAELKTLKEITGKTELDWKAKLAAMEVQLNALTAASNLFDAKTSQSSEELQKALDQVKGEKSTLNQNFVDLQKDFQDLKSKTPEINALKQKLESVERQLELERQQKSANSNANASTNSPVPLVPQVQLNDLPSPAKETNGVSNELSPEAHTPPRSSTPQPSPSPTPQLSSTSTVSSPASPSPSSGASGDQPKEKSKKKKGASKSKNQKTS